MVSAWQSPSSGFAIRDLPSTFSSCLEVKLFSMVTGGFHETGIKSIHPLLEDAAACPERGQRGGFLPVCPKQLQKSSVEFPEGSLCLLSLCLIPITTSKKWKDGSCICRKYWHERVFSSYFFFQGDSMFCGFWISFRKTGPSWHAASYLVWVSG